MTAAPRSFALLALVSASVLAAVALGQGGPGRGPAPTPAQLELRRQNGIRNANVHDPSTIVECNDEYYLFHTGNNCPSYRSKDLVSWTPGGPAFDAPPTWVQQEVPTFRGGGFWAPDVIKVKNKYMLFFSASAFGVNTSTIGVATNPTLDKNDPAYKWTHGGSVVTSRTNDDYNAIDPALLYDDDGRLWMAFGSFWSGIQLIELDPDTGLRLPNTPMTKIAHWDSIEGPYIYKHDGKYYLFVALGMCCRGANSTYNTRVGRADKITGPYLDKDGKDMLLGGGTPFLATTGNLIGPGHAGIIQVGDKYYYSCHYENTGPGGGTLSVRPLTWDADGWPVPGIPEEGK
jgi:arabinan endo-1,5-alpha-L-arabinosidase